MWIVVFFALLLSLYFLIRNPQSFRPHLSSRGKLEFFSKGMDAGFSLSEINLLWNASRRAELEKPPAIYGSVEELDKAINQIAGERKFSERKAGDPDTLILKKLFDYRKKVEMNRPRYKSGLKSTRDIAPGQKLRIRADGVGVYSSKVIENEQGYLTISIPIGDPLPPGFSWRNGKINVYFWRKEDAGYFFQTRLIDRFHDRRNLHFRVFHSDNILRSQKRRSVRAPARISARLYPLKSLEEANSLIESTPGLSCLIVDISEDGAALRIGGRGKRNQPFKLQFKIRDEILVVSGVIKRVNFESEDDQSTLHVEFLPLPEYVRMAVLAFVYDIDRSRASSENEEARQTLNVISGLRADSSDEEDAEVLEVAGDDTDNDELKA